VRQDRTAPIPLVALRTLAALATLAVAPTACRDDDGGGGGTTTGAEAIERPARPPPGWHTLRNEVAGFTLAAPRAWPAETTRRRTLLRSEDRLVSITVAADRSAAGRRLAPARYARRTIESLPGFEGTVGRRARPVRGSPYRSAVVDGSGTVSTTIRRQRISVAAFHQPGVATHAAVVFRNAVVRPRLNDRTIARILTSFRAARPRP
jgi:hypothetical protein